MLLLQQASLRSHCAVTLQESIRGGDPAPTGRPFQSWREDKVMELPGPR